MKLRYGICLFSLLVLITGAYYAGYDHFRDRSDTLEESSEQETKEAAVAPEPVLEKQGRYVMEFYDSDTGHLETVTMELPAELAGKTKKEALAYLEKQEAAFLEVEPGFLRMELLAFSPAVLTVKKVYSSMQEAYQYYLIEEDGMVVVYESDRETFYRYTNMQLSEFPEEMQEEIRTGCYVKDLTELYDLLENAGS